MEGEYFMATKVYCSMGTHHLGLLGYRMVLKNFNRNLRDIEVVSWKNGIVTVNAANHGTKSDWALTIAGCFDPKSNFTSVLRKYYGDSRKKNVKGIQFKYEGAIILITKRSAKVAIILKKMQEQDLLLEKIQAIHNKRYYERCSRQYIATLKEGYRENVLKEKIKEVSYSSDIEFKDEFSREMWNEFIKPNLSNTQICEMITRAYSFAKYVQYLIKKHNKPLCYFAEKAMRLTHLYIGTYSLEVVEMLCLCWVHGDELFNFCKENKTFQLKNEVGI